MNQPNSRTIVHPGTGEEITFLKTSEETAGSYEYIEVFLPPGGEGPPLHYHGKFEETFRTLEGKLQINLKEDQQILLPGDDEITIPKETYHQFVNGSAEEPVRFTVTLTPAHQFETSMRIIYGLIADGQVNPDGTFKNPLHMALALDMQDTHILGIEGLEPLAKEAYDKNIDQELIDTYITGNR